MKRLLLRRGDVLDPASGTLDRGASLLIEGNTIVDSGHDIGDVPDAEVIDASGRTLIPGLIDCHVHVLASNANLGANAEQPNSLAILRALPTLKSTLQRGFTTVRDAGGADWALAKAVEDGLIPGPRIFPSGKALSQTGGHGDFRRRSDYLEPCSCCFRAGSIARVVDGVDNVRIAVREELQKGAEQIKIMASGGVASPVDPIGNTQYSEAEIRAIVEEAEAANTYVMAHAYTARAIARAVRFGVRTIEHGNLVDRETADTMAALSAFAVPTLITYDMLAKYGTAMGLSQESASKIETVRSAGRESLRIFQAAGVRMGFGSDLLGDMQPYQSEEFAIRAGVLGTLAALQSATTVAAEVLRKSGELGTLRPGARADVVVCAGNPLEDISLLSEGSKGIVRVIQGGVDVTEAIA